MCPVAEGIFLHERRPLGLKVLDGMQVRTNPQFSLQAATNSLWAMAVLASAQYCHGLGSTPVWP